MTPTLFWGDSELEDVIETSSDDEEDRDPQLVGDYASAWGHHYVKVEFPGLITGLPGTGSDEPPSPLRAMLIGEMRTRDVANPNSVLSSPTTALVLVRALIPPAAQKGEQIDIEVRSPARSDTEDLDGGWLLETRLKEVDVERGRVLSGHVRALAKGPVLTDASLSATEDSVLKTRGVVLGGGVVLKDRPLGLVLKPEHKSVRESSLVGNAINARFHTYEDGIKRGVANPTRDNFIELKLHPRYQHNVARFIAVARGIPVTESAAERIRRLDQLESELMDARVAARAAILLEAIGPESERILVKGLSSPDPEVRFYAAESLAYLNNAAGVKELAAAARQEPAFRKSAMTALASLDDIAGFDALATLLDHDSAETRYGAFTALRLRGPTAPLVRGEWLGDFSHHVMESQAPPLLHFSRAKRREVVLFGKGAAMRAPFVIFAGREIMIKAEGDTEVAVTHYQQNGEDVTEHCTAAVDDVVRAVAKVGGSYSQLLMAMQEAKKKKVLGCRLAMGTVPRIGRTYNRDEKELGPPSQRMAHGDGEPHDTAILADGLFDHEQSGAVGTSSQGDAQGTAEDAIDEWETPGLTAEQADKESRSGRWSKMLSWPFGF